MKLYLPNGEKTKTVYQVIKYWQGVNGSWDHGWYQSALFENREDAERFRAEVKERWQTGSEPNDLPKNYDYSDPEIIEVDVLLEYAAPGNGNDFTNNTYTHHVCRED